MSSSNQARPAGDTAWYKRKPLYGGLALFAVLRGVRKARRAADRHRGRVALRELRKDQRRRAHSQWQREQREQRRRQAEREWQKRQRKARRRLRRRLRRLT